VVAAKPPAAPPKKIDPPAATPEPAPPQNASKLSLTATIAAALDEPKAPAPKPRTEPTPKAREEPVAKPATNAATNATATAPSVSASELWVQLVTRVRKERPLIAGWVESGQLVEIKNGIAVLAFPTDETLARENCERPNNRPFLETILSELAGQPITLKCELRAGLVVEKVPPTEVKPEPSKDPMEAFKNDPLIQKALAAFKAEIIPA